MKLKDMIETIRSPEFYRIELRDGEGEELMTCRASSEALEPYMETTVWDWIPHGGIGAAHFIVCVETEDHDGSERSE